MPRKHESPPVDGGLSFGTAHPDPRENITVVPLAHGCRVDIVAAYPGGDARTSREHFADRAKAEAYARFLSRATGFPVLGLAEGAPE